MAGYTRQSSAEIVDGNTIDASDFNNEFNTLQTAFDSLAGHVHDGTLGSGAPISYNSLTNAPTLGTAAAHPATDFAQVVNNLSDLSNTATARTNLGLGTSAVQNVGTAANNVVQLNGSSQLPAVDGSQLINLTTTQLNGMLPSQTGNNGKFLSTNGASVAWTFTGVTGTNVTNPMSSNLTLVSSSASMQTVAPNAQGLSINLPNATTCVTGSLLFTLKNTGLWYVWILDASGNAVSVLMPSATVIVSLESNSTPAGQWRFTTSGDDNEVGVFVGKNPGYSIINNATQTPANTTCQLSATNSIVVSAVSTTSISINGYIDSNTGNIIGSTLLSLTVGLSVSANYDIVALTSTTALLIYQATSTEYMTAVVLTLNTSTGNVTAGTAVTMDNTLSSSISGVVLVAVSSTFAIAFYGSTNLINSYGLSVSGTTVTLANKVTKTITNPSYNYFSVQVLTGTLLHMYYYDSSTGINVVRITVSGTTQTFGTTVNIAATGLGVPYASAVQNGSTTVSACVIYNNTSNTNLSTVVSTDTGSTITVVYTANVYSSNIALMAGFTNPFVANNAYQLYSPNSKGKFILIAGLMNKVAVLVFIVNGSGALVLYGFNYVKIPEQFNPYVAKTQCACKPSGNNISLILEDYATYSNGGSPTSVLQSYIYSLYLSAE